MSHDQEYDVTKIYPNDEIDFEAFEIQYEQRNRNRHNWYSVQTSSLTSPHYRNIFRLRKAMKITLFPHDDFWNRDCECRLVPDECVSKKHIWFSENNSKVHELNFNLSTRNNIIIGIDYNMGCNHIQYTLEILIAEKKYVMKIMSRTTN